LAQLQDLMRAHGVQRLYAKQLSANDNSKNQVYFRGDLSVLNILPFGKPVAESRSGRTVQANLKASLLFAWLAENGNAYPAPRAKLILYPQYPEVRISGLLDGVEREHRPTALMGQTRVPNRVLFLGVKDDGWILGFAAGPDSRLRRELEERSDLESVGVLERVPLSSHDETAANRATLLHELCRISNQGWIDSKQLNNSGDLMPCQAPNCGGYTLEAELGVRTNSFSKPDFHGWEVKQHGVGSFARPRNRRITLMTPHPSDGYYVTAGVVQFCERWGYPDRRGREKRINFGGTYRVEAAMKPSGLTLLLLGFDIESCKITDAAGGIVLVSNDGVEAAVWRYADLIDLWKRKHAKAVYVPSETRDDPQRQYRYNSVVRLGNGTTFENFLTALAARRIIYDPGIKVERYPEAPIAKERNQFRILSTDVGCLYTYLSTVSVCDSSR